jgi:hypothetical protein
MRLAIQDLRALRDEHDTAEGAGRAAAEDGVERLRKGGRATLPMSGGHARGGGCKQQEKEKYRQGGAGHGAHFGMANLHPRSA